MANDNAFAKAILIRLFRVWSLAREDGASGLGPVHALAFQLRLPDESALASASLFELVESKLGRRLARECCCSRAFSADEIALLGLVEAAPALGGIKGSQDVPGGLSGAIRWAAMVVRRALGWSEARLESTPSSIPMAS